eukprot:TRINITY_DN226_c1_g7_i1.p1 TRINITY_DN226_c1_g7~~TRINITY_DN226_c1_g7_i1.p1  ORF type:complete len:237 (+),score=34.01 TRINITY_DN226_c1_g7_i1:171-881(+)
MNPPRAKDLRLSVAVDLTTTLKRRQLCTYPYPDEDPIIPPVGISVFLKIPPIEFDTVRFATKPLRISPAVIMPTSPPREPTAFRVIVTPLPFTNTLYTPPELVPAMIPTPFVAVLVVCWLMDSILTVSTFPVSDPAITALDPSVALMIRRRLTVPLRVLNIASPEGAAAIVIACPLPSRVALNNGTVVHDAQVKDEAKLTISLPRAKPSFEIKVGQSLTTSENARESTAKATMRRS